LWIGNYGQILFYLLSKDSNVQKVVLNYLRDIWKLSDDITYYVPLLTAVLTNSSRDERLDEMAHQMHYKAAFTIRVSGFKCGEVLVSSSN